MLPISKNRSLGLLLTGFLFLIMISGTIISCGEKLPDYTETNSDIELYPDYTSISIPPNIAPLNFTIKESAENYIVRFSSAGDKDIIVRSKDGTIKIPEKEWADLIKDSQGKEFFTDVFVRRTSGWEKFNRITNYVTNDSIDKYLVYRLIEPGFETWNKMGIYQRNLESFKETPVMLNTFADGNCINCHAFSKNSSDRMMFHIRGTNGGTVLYNNDELSKINTKTGSTISAGVYPAWHPSGDHIAYSVNNIVQSFHAVSQKKVEVYDTLSDVIVYDVRKNVIRTTGDLSDPDHLETFPTWSPDGRFLYFCSAKKQPAENYDQIRYDLMRIGFNQETNVFGVLDTIISASDKGKSISFPRISPDGRYLLYCLFDYGNFSIWHSESDLYLIDLSSGEISKPPINSSESESYHTWSSTGRWIVFSSRREDGLYTRPYFSYFDSTGQAHKPFVLPQEEPGFYFEFMKSFNIPELVTDRIDLDPGKLSKIVKSSPREVEAEF